MTQPTNDNDAGQNGKHERDTQGQAALLLTESLIHELIAQSVIGSDDAMKIVGIAADAADEIENDVQDSHVKGQSAGTILKSIQQSLSHDN